MADQITIPSKRRPQRRLQGIDRVVQIQLNPELRVARQ
jgi:hypothetical protein